MKIKTSAAVTFTEQDIKNALAAYFFDETSGADLPSEAWENMVFVDAGDNDVELNELEARTTYETE